MSFDENLIQALKFTNLTHNFRDAAKAVKSYTFILTREGAPDIDLRKVENPETCFRSNMKLLIFRYLEPKLIDESPEKP
jgi:hypothetical protein